MADGGEGTLDAFEVAVAGTRRFQITVQGPDDREVETSWLLLPDGTGVVELASSSGITLLEKLQPVGAHTVGFGQAIAAALDHGVARLLLAIGGSSSTDGGAGALAALGAVFLDADGQRLPPGNSALARLAEVDLSGLRPLPPGGAAILSDVTNPLLGSTGAAAIFGPQKGADASQIAALEANLERLALFLPGESEAAGAGAAGGTGFGLLAWGAQMTPGSFAVGEALGLPALVQDADVVITGEGRFDAQSADGKVPSYVAGLTAQSAQALLVAGQIAAPAQDFALAISLTELAGGPEGAMADPLRWLRQAGAFLAIKAG